jgi:ATP/maltotriose-dependent transcriptional regulator MalT
VFDTSTPLLLTKLQMPPIRADLVTREHLMRQLDDMAYRALGLILAPAGYGKSTLVAQWLKNRGYAAVWYTLDESDNDPARFLQYLVAALERINPSGNEDLGQLVHQASLERAESLLAMAINALARSPEQLYLVLDDYHLVRNPKVHQLLNYLLDHLPQQLHLLVLTRAEFPIHLSRLRSRRQLLELDLHHLRFSPAEVRLLLADHQMMDMPEAELNRLYALTEGWVTGLHLTLLALQNQASSNPWTGQTSAPDVLRAAPESIQLAQLNQYVFGFLLQESLSQIPLEAQHILHETSILEEVDDASAEALTGFSQACEILRQLSRNLQFVQPVDAQQTTFRYHPLFRAFLLDCLRLSGTQPNELHRKAAHHFQASQQHHLAVRHAQAAQATDIYVPIIRDIVEKHLWTGYIEKAQYWLDLLPQAEQRAEPHIHTQLLWVLLTRGQWEPLLQELELYRMRHIGTRWLPEAKPTGTETEDQTRWIANFLLLHSHIARMQGDYQRALNYSERLRPFIETRDEWRSWWLGNQGLVLLNVGRFAEAEPMLRACIPLAQSADQHYTAVQAYFSLARLLVDQGKFDQVEYLAEQMLLYLKQQNLRETGISIMVQITQLFVMVEQMRFGELEFLLADVNTALLTKGNLLLDALFKAQRARIAVLNREPDAIEQMHQAVQKTEPMLKFYHHRLLFWLVKTLLGRGEAEEANRWLHQLYHTEGLQGFELDFFLMARMICSAERGELETVRSLEAHLELSMDPIRGYQRLELALARAFSYYTLSQQSQFAAKQVVFVDQAQAAMREALRLAQAQQARFSVIEYGPAAEAMLGCLTGPQIQALPSEVRDYWAELLHTAKLWNSPSANPVEPHEDPQTAGTQAQQSTTLAVEPHPTSPKSVDSTPAKPRLVGHQPPAPDTGQSSTHSKLGKVSVREQEVLDLVRAGFSNREIADRLYVSIGTVKRHVFNLMQKMGVENRNSL